MPPRPPPLIPLTPFTPTSSPSSPSPSTPSSTRGLYPENTFLLTRAFNFPVPQNRHPQLCAYINSCITALTPHLQAGSISSISIIIYSDQNHPTPQILERYLFSLPHFPTLPPSERFTTFEHRSSGDPHEIRNIDVEEELRATLRKLAYSAGKLEALKNPEECTWGVVMEMKDAENGEGNAPIGHPQLFEPAVAELQVPCADEQGKGKGKGKESVAEDTRGRVGRARGGVKSTAIRAVEVGEFIMEAWIEEGAAKFEKRASQEHEVDLRFEG